MSDLPPVPGQPPYPQSPPPYPGGPEAQPPYSPTQGPADASYAPGQPAYQGQPPYSGQPAYQGPPAYQGQPPYSGQPAYQGPPAYQGQPPYSGQPAYQGPPAYQGQPPYSGQPPYPPAYGPPAGGWPQRPDSIGPAPGVMFAGHGARLGAYILDGLIVGIVLSALFAVMLVAVGSTIDWQVVTRLDRNSAPDDIVTALRPLLALIPGFLAIGVLGLLYFPFFWTRNGQTPGMMIAGIRVVRDRDGGPIGWGTAFLRLIGYWVSGAVMYLGFIWILIDGRRRGWHDLIAGTCVISAR